MCKSRVGRGLFCALCASILYSVGERVGVSRAINHPLCFFLLFGRYYVRTGMNTYVSTLSVNMVRYMPGVSYRSKHQTWRSLQDLID